MYQGMPYVVLSNSSTRRSTFSPGPELWDTNSECNYFILTSDLVSSEQHQLSWVIYGIICFQWNVSLMLFSIFGEGFLFSLWGVCQVGTALTWSSPFSANRFGNLAVAAVLLLLVLAYSQPQQHKFCVSILLRILKLHEISLEDEQVCIQQWQGLKELRGHSGCLSRQAEKKQRSVNQGHLVCILPVISF